MANVKLYTEFTPEVQENIVFKMINRKKNEGFLKTVPHIDYLDLAIIFYYRNIDNPELDGAGFVMITNALLELWKVDVDYLMELGLSNTPRILGFKVRGILSTIADYIGEEDLQRLAEEEDSHTPLYVATNNNAVYGAGVLIYRNALKALAAKFKSDLYIIPCSIHELIILKVIEGCEYSVYELKAMIHHVNRTELSEEDFLSDNLYFYNRSSGELGIV